MEGKLQLSRNAVGQRFAINACNQIIGCHERHPCARRDGRAANMWENDAVGERQQGVVGRERLGSGDIQTRGANLPGGQRSLERFLIHNTTATRVNQDGRRLHLRKCGAVKKMVSGIS